jgi:hypothetical protein
VTLFGPIAYPGELVTAGVISLRKIHANCTVIPKKANIFSSIGGVYLEFIAISINVIAR